MACGLLWRPYMKILTLSLLAILGCAGTGEVEYSGGVVVQSPELVTVQPGVAVIADADAPLFYSDGFYWLYRDGVWLRSDSYRGGFARVDIHLVPQHVRYIDHPEHYTHYSRHHGGSYAHPAPPPVRDHRHY